MTEYVLAYAIFLLAHVIPAVPALKGRLVGALGQSGYVVAYSTLSTGLLVWLIVATLRAPYVALWDAPLWTRTLALVVVPASLALLGAGVASANPLSVSFVKPAAEDRLPAIAAITRHPILWGFLLWSGAHVLPNGDVATAGLFFGFALFSLVGMVAVDAKKRRSFGQKRWQELTRSAPTLPFAAIVAGRARFGLDRAMVIGGLVGLLAAFAFLAGWHAALFGVDPLA
ncbi:MAG TPA: NnrU family protein [Kaistiaceae bacterium]|nr:NnrU family protein [Kaistiaceae bacterium]